MPDASAVPEEAACGARFTAVYVPARREHFHDSCADFFRVVLTAAGHSRARPQGRLIQHD
jgi:hypothetical protein